MSTKEYNVLIVDDEPDVTTAFSSYLSGSYNCIVAHNGQEALAKYNSDIDVVLLDRRIPDMSGDEILSEIRQQAGDPQIAMITAIEPDFDIISLGFDDYIEKPVTMTDVNNLVQSLINRAEYEQGVTKYYAMVSKKVALEESKTAAELRSNDSYQSLLEDIEDSEKELDELLQDISAEETKLAFRDLD